MRFPGLKPYSKDQSKNFLSREKEVESILEILQNNKLVTVTSKSGSGKTSLINAGVITRLTSGFPAQAGRQWSICITRPGVTPLENLCNSLANNGILYNDNKAKSTDFDEYLNDLQEKSGNGLVEIYNKSEIKNKKNLLIFIDQLEDLFSNKKFFDNETSNDDDLLIDIIFNSIKSKNSSIYFILNIQTSFLSNLNVYGKFSELLSSSQYVLPNINFSKLVKELIKNSNEFNINFSNEAYQKIESLVTEDSSLLPNLQLFFSNISTENNEKEIDLDVLKRHGDLKNIISKKINNYYENLNEKNQVTFHRIFKALIHADELDKNNFYQSFGYLKSYTCLNKKDLSNFITEINDSIGNLFDIISLNNSDINPIGQKIFNDSDIINLKYFTSLHWSKFRKWIKEEYENYELLLEFSNKANLYPKQESLLKGNLLETASKWINKEDINIVWAEKYSNNFTKTQEYINESISQNNIENKKIIEENNRNEKWKKRAKLAPFIILVFLSITIVFIYKESNEQKKILEEFQQKKNLYNDLSKTKDSLRREVLNFKENKLRFIDTIRDYRNRHISDSTRIQEKDKLISFEENIIKQKNITLNKRFNEIDSLLKQNLLSEKLISVSTDEIIFNNKIDNLIKEVKSIGPNETNFNIKIQKFSKEALELFNTYTNRLKIKNDLSNYSNSDFNNFINKSDANDINHLRELAINIISKINRAENYDEIEKYNLLDRSLKSLNSLTLSNNGKIATGGKNQKIYISKNKLDFSFKKDNSFNEIDLNSEILDLEFINENTLCARVRNNEIWYINSNKNEKVKLVSHKKRKLKNLLNNENLKGDRIKFIPLNSSIFSIGDKAITEYNLKTKKTKEINFDDLLKDEILNDIEYNNNNNLYLTTTKGNIINYNISNLKHSKILSESLGLNGNDIPSTLEIYNNLILIGTKNGWIYIYKSKNNNLVCVDRKSAHKSSVNNIHYNKSNDLIYSSSVDGTFTIIPVNGVKNNNQLLNSMYIQLSNKNSINSISNISYGEDNYIITIDNSGKMIYWDFDISDLFNEINILLNNK